MKSIINIKMDYPRQIPIIEIGVPNTIGFIYTEESAESLVKKFKDKENGMAGEIFGGINLKLPINFDLKKTTHIVRDLKIEDGFVIATVCFLRNKMGKRAISLLESGELILRPTIIGSHENRVIKIEDIFGFDLIPTIKMSPPDIKWISYN